MTHITIQRSEMETNNQIEVLAKQCGWDNRRYMTPSDYQIWCDRMRQFVQLASPPAAQPAPVPLALWTEAQHERAYRNSPELHKDVKSLAAFKRVAKEVAAMYGITKGQQ